MYITANNQSLTCKLDSAVIANELVFTTSFQDIIASGMQFPMDSSTGLTTGTSLVTVMSSPASATTRRLDNFSLFNADTSAAVATIYKTVAGIDYQWCKTLLQPGDTLEWSRDLGWKIFTTTTNQSYLLTEFIASGTFTKSQNSKRVVMFGIGAGGGGGSGRQGAAGENRFGGGGAGGGATVWRQFAASELPATITVTIGTGGTGGAAQASTSTNGNAGTIGGDTTIGAYLTAKGGLGGSGGTTTAGTAGVGGPIGTCVPPYGPFALSGANGAGGGTNAGGNSASAGFANTGGAAGAGGGGISSGNTSATTTGAGGGIYNNGALVSGATASAVTRPDGATYSCKSLFWSSSLLTTYGPGTGPSGGYPGSASSGAGGFGGTGAGGGGGAATLNGTASGRGGDGGNGYVAILEIF